jgi:hypothetical protein
MAKESYARPLLREGVGKEREDSTRAVDSYLDWATDYDPQEAINRRSQAQWNNLSESLGREIESLRGRQVGSGRVNSGFGFEDQDRLYEGAFDNLTNAMAMNALQGEQLGASVRQGLGAWGSDARNRYLELLSGEDDRFIRDNDIRSKKRGGLWGTLGGIAGGIGGFLLGGPTGAAAGWNIGSSAGTGLGQSI